MNVNERRRLKVNNIEYEKKKKRKPGKAFTLRKDFQNLLFEPEDFVGKFNPQLNPYSVSKLMSHPVFRLKK